MSFLSFFFYAYITGYCQGLPLAIQVLGSFLRDRTVVEWRSALEKLKRIPQTDIQNQLNISFDGLSEDNEKDLFLHIACFFVGWDKDDVTKVLNSCGLFSEIGLSVLTRRFLVEIYGNNKLQMHELIRDMGREIVRQESPRNPGKRSRLWSYSDILNILRNKMGTNKVLGLALNPPQLHEVSIEAFTGMNQLKLLELNNMNVHGKCGLLSRELRWICWHKFPLSIIPGDMYLGNMVYIDMQYSKLRATWNTQILKNLKILNLSHSHSLTKTPDFLNVPNLEKLILEDCTELREVHPSIGHLQRLVLLNLSDCKKLKNLPTTICCLRSLQILNIIGCSNINQLPDDLGEMEALVKLLAYETAIEQVPPSIARLKNLTKLSLYSHKSSAARPASSLWSWISSRESPRSNNQIITSLAGLTLLTSLSLMGCNISDFPISIDNLQSLQNLYLCENNFSELPTSISRLSNLAYFRLDDCPNLVALPEMPESLCYICTLNCMSLETISMQDVQCAVMYSSNCPKLSEISGLEKWNMDGYVRLDGCKGLSTKFRNYLLKEWQGRKYAEFVMPGSNIPDWFDYRVQSPSLTFRMPSCQSCKLKAVTVCVVGAYSRDINLFRDASAEIIFRPAIIITCEAYKFRSSITAHDDGSKSVLSEDHMVVFHLSNKEILEKKDVEVELAVNPGRNWNVKEVGIYFRREMCQDCGSLWFRNTTSQEMVPLGRT